MILWLVLTFDLILVSLDSELKFPQLYSCLTKWKLEYAYCFQNSHRPPKLSTIEVLLVLGKPMVSKMQVHLCTYIKYTNNTICSRSFYRLL